MGKFVVAASFEGATMVKIAGVVLLNAMDVSVQLAECNKNIYVNSVSM